MPIPRQGPSVVVGWLFISLGFVFGTAFGVWLEKWLSSFQ